MSADIIKRAGKAQRLTTFAAMLAALISAISGVALLAFAGWFLTGAAIAGAGGVLAVQAFNYLLPSAAIRGFAISRTASRYFERLLGHRAALLTLANVRPRLFALLAGAKGAGRGNTAAGAIASHLGTDVEALEDLAIRRIAMVAGAAGALAGLAAALLAGAEATLVLAAGLCATYVAIACLAPRWLQEPHDAHGMAVQRLKASYVEYASCGVEIALYSQTTKVAALLAEEAEAMDAARAHIVRREAQLFAIQLAFGSITVAAMLAVATGSAPMIALAALSAAGAFEAWTAVTHSLLQRSRVRAAQDRLRALFDLPQRAGNDGCDTPLPILEIGTATPSAPEILHPGERVRIAGPSGCGKTRLLATLAGLRDDAPQLLRVAGREVREMDIDTLRCAFSLSAQEAPLIAGTIEDNLRLAAPGIDEEQMWQALDTACLADTVRAMPEGLGTWLGAEGARLSGGQRKRLSLARALLTNRAWLMLDEPSEGLDAGTELDLADRLGDWLDRTGTGLLLVSHRPGLARLASRCITL